MQPQRLYHIGKLPPTSSEKYKIQANSLLQPKRYISINETPSYNLKGT